MISEELLKQIDNYIESHRDEIICNLLQGDLISGVQHTNSEYF